MPYYGISKHPDLNEYYQVGLTVTSTSSWIIISIIRYALLLHMQLASGSELILPGSSYYYIS